jgi:hypothetical protein
MKDNMTKTDINAASELDISPAPVATTPLVIDPLVTG